MGGDRGRAAHHVVKSAVFQAEPEGGGVSVAAVGHDQGDIDTPAPGLVDHVQGQLPLLDMAHVRRDAAPLAAGHLAGIGQWRGGIPALGEEQPPVDRRRRGVGGQVQGHARLAVGDLARGAGVLPRYTGRRVAVLEEARVIDDQRGRSDRRSHLPCEAGPHIRRIPRAGGDEVGQGLPVAVLAQPGGHRLHRFAPAVQEQTPQIHPAPPTLIRPRERLEHIRREVLQTAPDFIQLPRCHTRSTTHPIKRTRHRRMNLTKPY